MEPAMEALQREFIYIWYYFSVQFEQIFGYWVLGMALGSAVSVFAKDYIHRAFASLKGKRAGGFGIIAASVLGIASPLCMYGTIPLAASFMLTGPATKITNLGALKIVLGVRRFIVYLAYVMLFSLITGIIVNLIL